MEQTIISLNAAAEITNREKYEELLALDNKYNEKLFIANSILGRVYFRLRKFKEEGAPSHIIKSCETSIEKHYAKVNELETLKADNYAKLLSIPHAIEWENERLNKELNK